MGTRDQRAANARYYRRNRAREIERVRRRQDSTRDMLRAMRMRPCHDCGGTFPAHQMDFDHRDPKAKSFRLTSGRAMLASADALVAEAAKCDVVCANCHRVRTAHRSSQRLDPAGAGSSRYLDRKREYWRAQARLLSELKSAPCTDCARTFAPCAMDFDHRGSEVKRCTVSRMIGRVGTKTIVAEIAKCDIVCANCHRERTYRRREAGSSGRE